MRIYIAHSRDYDYLNELYKPLREDIFFNEQELILPHEDSNYSHTRDFYNDIDLFIAECSYPSIGLGIELGYAYDDNKPIYCIHKKDKNISGSIYAVTNEVYSYSSTEEMVELIKGIVKKHQFHI